MVFCHCSEKVHRSTFVPSAVEHQGDSDKERVDHLITHVRESMPCTGLQKFYMMAQTQKLTLVMYPVESCTLFTWFPEFHSQKSC